jgi:hypothetical protein
MKTQTEIRIPYELLTPEQKKEICNGCGGKGSWIKPPLRIFYKASCNHHDYGYWCGCTEAERKIDDEKLFQAMRKDCHKVSWFKRLLYRPWCNLYYKAVRLKGSEFFYWGEKKRWPAPTEEQLQKLALTGGYKA